MSEAAKVPPMRHCFNCGAELGRYRDHDPLDTCGDKECNRAAADAATTERAEAHETTGPRQRMEPMKPTNTGAVILRRLSPEERIVRRQMVAEGIFERSRRGDIRNIDRFLRRCRPEALDHRIEMQRRGH